MKRAIVILSIVLSGCSLQPRVPPVPVKTSVTLNVVGIKLCADQLREALDYYRSEGVEILLTRSASKTLVCLAEPSILTINRYTNFLPYADAWSSYEAGTAWVFGRSSIVVAHEIGHLLFGLEHSPGGLMAAFHIFRYGRLNDDQAKQARSFREFPGEFRSFNQPTEATYGKE
jgi:hypothetical protein